MFRTVKIKIPSIRRDVHMFRLTEPEIREIFEGLEAFVGDLDAEDVEVETVYETDDEAIYEMFVSLDYVSSSMYGRMIWVLDSVIEDFQEKYVDLLLEMSPEDSAAMVLELYVAAVSINPALDPMLSKVNQEPDPLHLELSKVYDMLPDTIASSIKNHLYRSYTYNSLDCDPSEIIGALEQSELDIDELYIEAPDLAINLGSVKTLTEDLKKHVVGQEHAIDHMYAIARRLAVGFRDSNKPPSVLLFAGPTGVGKTLLAKKSCELLFGSQKKFGRIDCATLAERHDVSKLLGAPPGYVGYPTDKNGDPKDYDPSSLWKEILPMGDDGGFLLLDEIEKAHPDIWDIFLTAFDEGYIKTSVGNVIDLRNIIIIMTTNLGSKELDELKRRGPIGFSASCVTREDSQGLKNIKKTAMDALRDYMKPELIGRITDVVPFSYLSKTDLEDVVDLEWAKAQEYLNKRVTNIKIDKCLKKHIANVCFDRGLGARPISRLLEQYAVDAVAEIYVEQPNLFESYKDIKISFLENNGECDVVNVNVDKTNKFEYVVRQSLTGEH